MRNENSAFKAPVAGSMLFQPQAQNPLKKATAIKTLTSNGLRPISGQLPRQIQATARTMASCLLGNVRNSGPDPDTCEPLSAWVKNLGARTRRLFRPQCRPLDVDLITVKSVPLICLSTWSTSISQAQAIPVRRCHLFLLRDIPTAIHSGSGAPIKIVIEELLHSGSKISTIVVIHHPVRLTIVIEHPCRPAEPT